MKFLQSFVNNKYFVIFIISFILFISKWHSFIFSEKNLIIEFLFNYAGDGKSWIPYIKFISELNFNNSFDPNIINLKILPIPVGSLFLHSLLFKFFNLYGLVLIELFVIVFFLLIFFKIFNKITTEINSLIYTLILFSFPELINFFDLNYLQLNNLSENFFSYRPHRPIFSNLFFYFSIYLLLKIIIEKEINKNNLYLLSVFFGLTFSSFFYFFIILSICFFCIISYKFGLLNFLKKQYLVLTKSFFIFIITATPFIFILLIHEKDVSKSAGLISLDYEQKLNLFKYYLGVFTNYKFLIILAITTLCTFTFKDKNNQKINKITLLLFFIFLSSILAPLLFILISPSSGLIYHFNNNIILTSFLFFSIFIFLKIFDKIKIKKFYLFVILIIIILFNISSKIKSRYEVDMNINSNKLIKEFSLVTKNVEQDFKSNLDTVGILTFDPNIMIWGILNDIKYFTVLNHMWAPKNYDTVENDLIYSLKFLNIKVNDFKMFFENNFNDWRYFNNNVGSLLGYRYQANSLVSKKYHDFENLEMKKFIMNSPPNHNQQIAIHKLEIKRLVDKFNSKAFKNFRKPEIIIINNDKNFLKNHTIDEKFYCTKYQGSYFTLYYLIEKNNCLN
jgi:hypothetical protein